MLKLQLSGVTKNYGNLEVLSPTDLEVRQGEFVTLLGPSGSGKTTLLKMIAGITDVTKGRIVISGNDVTRVPARHRDLAMVFQNYALVPHMTVFENIAFPLKVRKMSAPDIRKKVNTALATVRLDAFANRKPSELSGGQQQRVAIARALVYDPSLVLMDEPLGALDKRLRDQLQEEISRLHRQLDITVVYVTHDQQEAMSMSDRIVLMNNGRIEQVAAPEDLYRNPETEFAAEFLGESNFLPGTADTDGTRGVIRLASGETVVVPRSSSVQPRSAVKVMVRPERLSLNAVDGPLDNGLNTATGSIVERTFLGGVVRHLIELSDGTVVRSVTSSEMPKDELAPGNKTRISWRPDDSIVFRTKTSH